MDEVRKRQVEEAGLGDALEGSVRWREDDVGPGALECELEIGLSESPREIDQVRSIGHEVG